MLPGFDIPEVNPIVHIPYFTIPEIAMYGAKKRSVISTTIPHLREKKLGEILIPIVDSQSIQRITELVTEAFQLKSKRKKLLMRVDNIMNEILEV